MGIVLLTSVVLARMNVSFRHLPPGCKARCGIKRTEAAFGGVKHNHHIEIERYRAVSSGIERYVPGDSTRYTDTCMG